MSKIIAILCFGLALCASHANALEITIKGKTPKFKSPVQCNVGEDCWVVNYVDMNPAPDQAQDFKCTRQTYEGHKGTDFALRSRTEMKSGVDVIAPLAGMVLRVRDGENDSVKSNDNIEAIKAAGRECGNGILIDHGAAGYPGLNTVYCHLKQDSIAIKPQDIVTSGQKLAQIGQSGMAEFPHLHFGITWEGGITDPFSGALNTDGCGVSKKSLWDKDTNIKYSNVAIYDAGFKNAVPDFAAIKEGQERTEVISANSNAFIFWAGFYGAQAGDKIHLKVTGPKGKKFIERNITQEKSRARQFYYTGRKLRGRTLPTGEYTGTITVNRNNAEPVTRTEKITLR